MKIFLILILNPNIFQNILHSKFLIIDVLPKCGSLIVIYIKKDFLAELSSVWWLGQRDFIGILLRMQRLRVRTPDKQKPNRRAPSAKSPPFLLALGACQLGGILQKFVRIMTSHSR